MHFSSPINYMVFQLATHIAKLPRISPNKCIIIFVRKAFLPPIFHRKALSYDFYSQNCQEFKGKIDSSESFLRNYHKHPHISSKTFASNVTHSQQTQFKDSTISIRVREIHKAFDTHMNCRTVHLADQGHTE